MGTDEPQRPSLDCELGEYVRAFSASSNRVRWLIGSVLVTALLVFIGYRNSQYTWRINRVELAKITYHCELWEPEIDIQALEAECGYRAARIGDARKWAKSVHLRSKREAWGALRGLENLMLRTVATLRVPFLGLYFDVNDLGIVGGAALALLMISLAYALSQQEENFSLSSWKINQLADGDPSHQKQGKLTDEEVAERHGSAANVLYHALAIAQAFQKPPTLARYGESVWHHLHLLIFVAPIIVQLLVLKRDRAHLDVAVMYNAELTRSGLATQWFAIVITSAAALVCVLVTVANHRRWRRTFFKINQHLNYRGEGPDKPRGSKPAPWLFYLFPKLGKRLSEWAQRR